MSSLLPEHNSSTVAPGQKPVRRCCESCHQRKVRCDVDLREGTCKNCSLDGRPCKIRTPLKRGRKKRVHLQETSVPPRDGHVDNWQRYVDREDHVFDDSGHASASQGGKAPVDGLPNDGATTTGYISYPDINIDIIPMGDHDVADSNVPFYYHKYLKVADMSHLSTGQFRSLELNGCFQVPIDSYLDVFIHQYFLYVHTCLPLLNEGDFWAMYSGHDAGGKPCGFSLALFQAMLFAASRFVPINVMKACGFKELKSMRDTFHRRAELLLTHNLETDSIVLAQTSLLLSLQPTLYDQSLNSIWLSKAISYAEDAGASVYFTKPYTDIDQMLEKKRLWWCCILRDRMIAIGARRSIQINAEKFDFKNAGLQETDLADEVNKSNVYSPEMKRLLAKVIMAQCALAAAMTATMTAIHPTDSSSLQGPSTVSQLVTSTVEIERGNTELMIWARQFESELIDCIQEAPDPSGAALFSNMTLIHYYSAQVALYNHLALVLQKHQSLLEDFKFRFINLQKDLQQAIAGVTERFQGLRDAGLAHRLPISAPSCTALPVILETVNLQLSSPAQRAAHQRQLSCYNEIISLLDDQHEYTGCVTSAINSLLPVADAEIKEFFKSRNRRPSISNAGNNTLNMTLWAPSSWSDLFMKSPMIYLRISMSLDIALCQGKTPHVMDLPAWMRNLQILSPSIPQTMLSKAEYRLAGEAEEIVEGRDQGELRTERDGDSDILRAGPFTEGLGFVCEDLASLGSIGLWLNSI